MKRQALISFAIVVFSLFTNLLSAKVDSSDWQNHFNEQFERLQAWNEKCIQEKRYDETKYFIGYTPFEDFDLTSSACETNTWWKYWDAALEGSNQDFIQGDYCQELSCRLRSFNLANGEESLGSSTCGNYQNPNNVQVYAFFLNYWGVLSANVEGLENEKLLPYLTNNKPVDYKNYLQGRTQALSRFEFPDVGGNNILIYTSRFVVYNGQANAKKAIYQNTIKSSGSFIKESKDCAYEFGLTNAGNIVYPNGTSDYISARQFFRRVVTTLDYYANPQSDCSGCDKSILVSLEQFSSDKAKEFVIDNCAAIKEDPTKLTLVLEIAKHIQKREDFFKTAALGVDPLPDTYWVGQWESLDSILAFMNDLNLSVEERLSGLIEQLRWAIANQDGATVYNLLAALQGRDSGYYINLPIDVRIGAIATMANFLPGDALSGFGFGDREQEVINLLSYVPGGSGAKCAILASLREEHQQTGLLSTLMSNLNNWFGANNRYEFVKAIKVLAQQGQCDDAIPSEPITIWWQSKESGISFEAPVIENYTYNIEWAPTGLIDFNIQVCTAQDFTEVEGEGTFYYCTEWQDIWEPVDPFALIDVVLLDKVKVIDDCIGNSCKGKVLKGVPAIVAYYLFTQEALEGQKDDALLALDIVLAATGVGDIYLALKLGNTARLALAGYYFSSDVLSITVNNENFQDWVLSQPNGAKTLEFIQSAELINSLLAGSVALLDLTATAKFVAASEKITTFPNAPPGLIDENTEKIIDAARKELDRGYQGPEELNLRRLQLSGWSVEDLMAHFGITDPVVGSNLFDLYLNGKLPVNDLLGDKFTEAIKNLGSEELINDIFKDIVTKPDLFEMLAKENGVRAWEFFHTRSIVDLKTDIDALEIFSHYRGSEYSNYEGWSESVIRRHLDDVKNIPELRSRLREDPELIEEWESLRGDDELIVTDSDLQPSSKYWPRASEIEGYLGRRFDINETGGFSNSSNLPGYGVLNLDQFSPSPSTAFSGVFDVQEGRVMIYPSAPRDEVIYYSDGTPIPEGHRVNRRGGHRTIRTKMIEYFGDLTDENSMTRVVGFTIKYENVGEWQVEFFSRSCNHPFNRNATGILDLNDPFVPNSIRPDIIDALNEEFNNIRGYNLSITGQ